MARKPYEGRGFIPTKIRGPKNLYDYLWSLTELLEFDIDPQNNIEMRKKVHHFLAHIYNSQKSVFIKKESTTDLFDDENLELFIPVYCRLIDKTFSRDFKTVPLKNKYRLIEMTGSNNLLHISRCYRLPDENFHECLEIENQDTKEQWNVLVAGKRPKRPVNIINGAPDRAIRTDKYHEKERGFKLPDDLKRSIKSLSPCVFNPVHIKRLVDYREKTYRRAKNNYDKALLNPEISPEQMEIYLKDLRRLKKKFINERSSQQTILYQQPKLLKKKSKAGNPLYSYQVANRPQVSGRLSEIGGGIQNASRYFKKCAFNGVKHYNYDLKGSQANILIHELKDSGIDNTWIKNYMADPNAKYTYSKRVDLDTDTWKTCLYAAIMGSEPSGENSAIKDAIREYYQFKYPGNNTTKLERKSLNNFIKEAKGLLTSVRKWRNYIISPDSHYLYDSKKDYYHWQNACGMRHKIYGLSKRNGELHLMDIFYEHQVNPEKTPLTKLGGSAKSEAERKLTAFILQGQEAHFIHHLTLLCTEHDIKVLRNEHDGLITDSEITDELVEKASRKSKLKGAALELKALASTDDRDKVKTERKLAISIGKKIQF
ncbi:hypothetical protein [Desulfogranum marinum]|uniref:hypothetical protein n=1 Tax=Desulfogranum marinum TaxID=453220 RepID=UPI0019652E40|nr:hypothetical protein [Desulfogranum marinum]MBM9515193.1 hypothetical protein [Desulfogranum marinum]